MTKTLVIAALIASLTAPAIFAEEASNTMTPPASSTTPAKKKSHKKHNTTKKDVKTEGTAPVVTPVQPTTPK